MPRTTRSYWYLLKRTISAFSSDHVIRLSASLAYYTVFSIGPLLLVIISLAGVFFERNRVTDVVQKNLYEFLGSSGGRQVMAIITRLQEENDSMKFSIIGIVLLIFGATTIFTDMQNSINYIWSIRVKPKKGWIKFLKNRLLSFSVIIGIGFLLMASLVINTLVDVFTQRLQELFINEAVLVLRTLNLLILFFITSLLFAVIYKVLPDARIMWKDALTGAVFTSVLFLIGKFLIGVYLSQSNLANTYGAAASVIILLSWVYYSSTILYFGAEFTKIYALERGGGIVPYDNAVFIIKEEAREWHVDSK